ncbi:hypothetical protein CTI14_68965, partial [Methylobacterium radiotolerans]
MLVAFLAGIGVLLAAMSWQGRVVREYGQTVLKAAQAAPLDGNRPCVLVAFLAGIGVLLAAMSWQGRVVREYGQTVLK